MIKKTVFSKDTFMLQSKKKEKSMVTMFHLFKKCYILATAVNYLRFKHKLLIFFIKISYDNKIFLNSKYKILFHDFK